jgi:hypothetical protein
MTGSIPDPIPPEPDPHPPEPDPPLPEPDATTARLYRAAGATAASAALCSIAGENSSATSSRPSMRTSVNATLPSR